MKPRKIHFRHPAGASDVPLCNEWEYERITTERPSEVQCRTCQKILKEENISDELDDALHTMYQQYYGTLWGYRQKQEN